MLLSDVEDEALMNTFEGEENDESIEAIQEAIDQMGVDQPDNEFDMAVQAGSEYAYLLAGSEEEKKRFSRCIIPRLLVHFCSYPHTFFYLFHSANYWQKLASLLLLPRWQVFAPSLQYRKKAWTTLASPQLLPPRRQLRLHPVHLHSPLSY